MNKIIVTGNLTKDPEVRETAAGEKVCNFSVAVQRNFTNENGERGVDYLNVVAWNKLAETVMKYCKKGDKVGVAGRIQIRSWQDKEGVKKYATEIVAAEVEFLYLKKQDEAPGEPQEAPKPQGRQKSMFDKKKSIDELEPVFDEDLPFL